MNPVPLDIRRDSTTTARSSLSPLDRVLVVFFALFAVGWMTSDLPNALGIEWAPNDFYAERIDPLFAHPPLGLHIILKVAGFIYGPFYLATVYALLRRRAWLPRLAIPVAAAVSLTTVIYILVDVLGAEPPRALPAFFLLNGPYAVIPLLLIYRCLASHCGRGSPLVMK